MLFRSVNGRHVEQTAAAYAGPGFKSVGLELGGKDAAYVRAGTSFVSSVQSGQLIAGADSDPAYSAENLVDGAFFNAGQSCCGIERIYVAESCVASFSRRCSLTLPLRIYDEFVALFVKFVNVSHLRVCGEELG